MALGSASASKTIASAIFLALAGKLANAPYVAGELESDLGILVNRLFDIAILAAVAASLLATYKKYLTIYAVAALTALTYGISTALYSDESIATFLANHLRVYLPLMALPPLLRCYSLHQEWFLRWIKRTCLLVAILLVVGLTFFSPVTNRQEVWWPSYFGGLHTNAYVALTFSALIYCLALKQEIDARFAALIIAAVAVFIYFGWGVRTATIATIVFIGGVLLSRTKGRCLLLFALVVAALVISVFYLLFAFDFEEADLLTSGRLAMYSEKYNQLMNNTVVNWIIGSGAGSDIVESDVWWWAEKGAHSDLITMLVEGGVVYLIGFIWVVVFLLKQGQFAYKALIVSALLTSAVSNGIFVRPMAGYLLVMAMIILSDHRDVSREVHSGIS